MAKRLIDGITAEIDSVVRNGDANGYPGCVNLSFAYVEGESLLMALKVGSACDGLCKNSTKSSLTLQCVTGYSPFIRFRLHFGVTRTFLRIASFGCR